MQAVITFIDEHRHASEVEPFYPSRAMAGTGVDLQAAAEPL